MPRRTANKLAPAYRATEQYSSECVESTADRGRGVARGRASGADTPRTNADVTTVNLKPLGLRRGYDASRAHVPRARPVAAPAEPPRAPTGYAEPRPVPAPMSNPHVYNPWLAPAWHFYLRNHRLPSPIPHIFADTAYK